MVSGRWDHPGQHRKARRFGLVPVQRPVSDARDRLWQRGATKVAEVWALVLQPAKLRVRAATQKKAAVTGGY
jgi:hypothetical protein